ncbi:hypothetical protein ABK040_012150 [Willaertia magna]
MFTLFKIVNLMALALFLFIEDSRCGTELNGGGSTQAYFVHHSLSQLYPIINKLNTNIKYNPIGSGEGLTRLKNGEYDFSGTEEVLTKDFSTRPNLRLIPFFALPVALTYNIPELKDHQLILTRELIVQIFNGTIRRWSDPRIVAVQEVGVSMPDKVIRRVVRSESSGATEIFTSALSSFSDAWNKTYGVANKLIWPTSGNNTNIIYAKTSYEIFRQIIINEYSIGYNVPYSEFGKDLKYALIVNKHGKTVGISLNSIVKAIENSVFNDDFTVNIVDTDSEDGYPIVGYTYFAYDYQNMTDCKKAVLLYKYLNWIFSTEPSTADSIIITQNGVPLDKSLKLLVLQKLELFTCKGNYVKNLATDYTYIIEIVVSIIFGPLIIVICVTPIIYLYYRNLKLKRMIHSVVEGPKSGQLAIMFTDVQNSTHLWSNIPHEDMSAAILLHNDLFRQLIEKYEGYEVKTEGDSFMIVFGQPVNAFKCALELQYKLMFLPWPRSTLNSFITKEITNEFENVLFRGLRVRMGIHVMEENEYTCELDPNTKRSDYFGGGINLAARIGDKANGGSIWISEEAYNKVVKQNMDDLKSPYIKILGTFELQGISDPKVLYLLLPSLLSERDGRFLMNAKESYDSLSTSTDEPQFNRNAPTNICLV